MCELHAIGATRRKLRVRVVLVALVGLASVLAACGDDGSDEGAQTAQQQRTMNNAAVAGRVEGTDAFVAIAGGGARGELLAYVCDSKEIGEWFRGTAGSRPGDPNYYDVNLTSQTGATLKLHLQMEGASGTFTPKGGEPHDFDATPTTGDAGLYRAEATLKGAQVLGGWIVLPNGEQRGTVRIGSTVQPAPTLSTSNPTVNVINTGQLEAALIDPFEIWLL